MSILRRRIELSGGKKLVSIAVTTAPTKTEYATGDIFDPTGMIITATYDDESTAVISGYSYTPSGALSFGYQKIIITYKNVSTSLSVLVYESGDPLGTEFLFTASAAGTCGLYNTGSYTFPIIQYQISGTSKWLPLTIGGSLSCSNGTKIYFRGNNSYISTDTSTYLTFKSTGAGNVSGNIMSLIDKSCQSVTISHNYCFYRFFYNCTTCTFNNLLLPATALVYGCYYNMFRGCSALTTAPDLPAVTVPDYGYTAMFMDCYYLTATPKIFAAKKTGFYSCNSMFLECYRLVTINQFLIESVGQYGLGGMFKSTAITRSPELLMTSLPMLSLNGLFEQCSQLNYITFNATSWYTNVYATSTWVRGVASTGTFVCHKALGTNSTISRGETYCPENWTVINYEDPAQLTIVTAPAKVSYNIGDTFDPSGMVINVTYYDGSTKEVTDYTYSPSGALTAEDTNITISYTENDITVTAQQPIEMIVPCVTSIVITTPPTKTQYTPGTVFDTTGMVITANYDDGSCKIIENYTYTPSGELTIADTYITISYTEKDITVTAVQNITVSEPNYLRFIASAAGTCKFGLSKTSTTLPVIYYRKNTTGSWSAYTFNSDISVAANDTIYFKGDNTFFATDYVYFPFSSTINGTISGNIMSLIDSTCTSLIIPSSYCFKALFKDCKTVTFTDLILPATTLQSYCYEQLFYNSSITKGVELPAINAQTGCYYLMYANSTVVSTGNINLETTASQCCYQMFEFCSKLTSVCSTLKSASLSYSCYEYMFYYCTTLTSTPALPALNLANRCYAYMFGHTAVTTMPALKASTLASYCYYSMFAYCTKLTVLTSLSYAKTMCESCYAYMFQGCTSLTNYITYLPATTLATNCYASMYYNTGIEISATSAYPYKRSFTFFGATPSSSTAGNMLSNTKGTFTGTPTTTDYYTRYTNNLV